MESRLLKRHARYFVALSSSSLQQQQRQQTRGYSSHYTLVSGDDLRTVGKLAPQRLHGLEMITSVVAHGGGGLRSRVLSDGVMRAWTPLITTGQFFSRGMAAAGASPAREVVGADEQEQQQELERTTTTTSSLPEAPGLKEAEEVGRSPSETSKYWGVVGKTYTKEDGSTWSWKCFKPSDTYQSDMNIDLKKHHKPENFSDSFAYWTVKSLRIPTDLFFRKRYGCRAMMLETVAAVPGMVGGMLLHCQSLRRFQHSGGWIKALLEEAENERMHLMTFMEVSNPKWYERALVFTVQGIFFNAYFLLYVISPRLAHRITGYLEEEAIYSYTSFLAEIDNGHIPNGPAPSIAIDYWRLPKDATIRDVVMVVRADEAHHRDVNHFAADIHKQGKELHEAPAPVGYH